MLFLVSQPARAAKKDKCGDVFNLAKNLLAEKHLAYTATGIAFNIFTVQLFTQWDGRWAILAIIDPDNACILLEGTDWDWVIERKS